MLIPKKHSEIVKQLANELSLDEELVQDVTSFYWKNIRQNVSNLTHERITIRGLGDFRIKRKKVQELLDKYNSMLSKFNCSNYRYMKTYEEMKNMVDDLNHVKDSYDKDMQRLIEHKRKRKEDESKISKIQDNQSME